MKPKRTMGRGEKFFGYFGLLMLITLSGCIIYFIVHRAEIRQHLIERNIEYLNSRQ